MSSSGTPEVKDTAGQLASNQINAKLWDYYQTEYKPLLDKYITKTMDPGNRAQEKEQVAGQINADVMKQIDPTKASVNPAQNARQLTDLAKLDTTAQVTGEAKVRGRQLGEAQNIINIGRGQATNAQADLSSLAGSSLQAAIGEEEAKQTEDASTENMIGSGIGTTAGIGMRVLKDPQNWDKNLFGTAARA